MKYVNLLCTFFREPAKEEKSYFLNDIAIKTPPPEFNGSRMNCLK